jgi:anti-anti-sigma factor
MTGPAPTFAIRESHTDEWLRLSLTGELDMASAPVLEARLTSLRALKSPVILDLSKLDFIDSTGLHLLIRELGEARLKHWELRIEPDVSAQVMRLFKLVHVEHLVLDAAPVLRPPGRGRPRPASSKAPSAT